MAYDRVKDRYYLDQADFENLRYYIEKRIYECNNHLKTSFYEDTVNYWEQEKFIAEELKITLIAMERD